MATESMFVEPEVVIKEEPLPSACEEESFSDTSSEAPSDCSDSSATRTTSRVDRAESMAHQSNDENRVRSSHNIAGSVGADYLSFSRAPTKKKSRFDWPLSTERYSARSLF